MELTVLLVDDEPNLLHSLSRVLRNEPYRIYTARTADESIAIVKSHRIDLVVSDENMPGMSGTNFLAWVAEVLPEVPRFMLTGQSGEYVKHRALNEARVDRFFTKPCNAPELAQAIRASLKQRVKSL